MAKSKRWALYLKNWVSYGDFRRSRYDKISLSPNFQMSISHWNFEIGGQFFACDHNFYRFQNNFLQHRVSEHSFIDFSRCDIKHPSIIVHNCNKFLLDPFLRLSRFIFRDLISLYWTREFLHQSSPELIFFAMSLYSIPYFLFICRLRKKFPNFVSASLVPQPP